MKSVRGTHGIHPAKPTGQAENAPHRIIGAGGKVLFKNRFFRVHPCFTCPADGARVCVIRVPWSARQGRQKILITEIPREPNFSHA